MVSSRVAKAINEAMMPMIVLVANPETWTDFVTLLVSYFVAIAVMVGDTNSR